MSRLSWDVFEVKALGQIGVSDAVAVVDAAGPSDGHEEDDEEVRQVHGAPPSPAPWTRPPLCHFSLFLTLCYMSCFLVFVTTL